MYFQDQEDDLDSNRKCLIIFEAIILSKLTIVGINDS